MTSFAYKYFFLFFVCFSFIQCRHSLKEADRELSLQENILPHQPLKKTGDTLEHTLANGMKVILQEQHGAKVVALQVWVNVGSADETDNEAGIAHVHEHMLFKGTKKRKVGEIARDVEAVGGDINAWTSFDQTVYHIILGSKDIEKGLDILADVMQNSLFDHEELKKELEVILEEIKRSNDSPERVVGQNLFRAAFREHFYRRPIIGYEEIVKNFSRDQILAFYKRWYSPKNLTLVVVGDFSSQAIVSVIEKKFSDFSDISQQVSSQRKQEPAQNEFRSIVAFDSIQETFVEIGWHIPPILHEDIFALDVLSVLLGQGDSSQLNRIIKREKQLANEIASYAYTPKDPGIFTIMASFHHEKTEPLLKEISSLVRDIANHPMSLSEIEKSKKIILSESIYEKETVQGIAKKLGFFYTVAGSLDFEKKYYEGIQNVSAHDIMRVAKTYLHPDNATISLLAPKEAESVIRDTELETWIREGYKNLKTQQSKLVQGLGNIFEFQIPHGPRVFIQEDHSNQLVALKAIYKGGLLLENETNQGINNLIAQLLTMGTKNRSSTVIAAQIDAMASSMEGFSGRNSLGLEGLFLSQHFENGFDIFWDSLFFPAFDNEETQKAKTLTLEEIRTFEDHLSSYAFQKFSEVLYETHPYRFPIHGIAKTVEKFTATDLKNYYFSHYHPRDLVIVIVGDVNVSHIMNLIQEKYKSLRYPKSEMPLTAMPEKEKPLLSIKKKVVHKNKEQAHLVIGFPGITIDSPDRYAFEVLSSVLSGMSGRLFQELREKQSLAYTVTSFSLEGVDPGFFALYMGTSPFKVEEAQAGLMLELKKLKQASISSDELIRAQNYLTGVHEIGLQKVSARAATIATSVVYGLGYDEYLHYSENIKNVNLSKLHDIISKYINLENYAEVLITPETEPIKNKK